MHRTSLGPLKTLQYEYRGLEEQHADAGNQFIPETTSTSEHTSFVKVFMKFDEVVVQGLEERFVDRNGMAHFGVMTASRIPASTICSARSCILNARSGRGSNQ